MTAILTCVRCYRRAQRRPGTWEGDHGAASTSPSRCETDCRPARPEGSRAESMEEAALCVISYDQ